MIRGVFAFSMVAALGLATLPIEAKGFGWHASHAVSPAFFRRSSVRHYNRAFGYYPYGGLVVANYANGVELANDVSMPQALGPLIPAAFVMSCHHSVETVTVPSERGGTREITIRRC